MVKKKIKATHHAKLPKPPKLKFEWLKKHYFAIVLLIANFSTMLFLYCHANYQGNFLDELACDLHTLIIDTSMAENDN